MGVTGMPLTMKDIARMLGVSESTVSRAINGQPGVSQKTRERILELVKELNYQPNSLAKGLALQKTCTLGLLLPDITEPQLMQIVKGIEERASSLGYHLILANTGGNLEKEISYLSLFKQNRCDGIIFVGGSLSEEEILKLGLTNYPLVLVNKFIEELALPTLLIDHQMGAQMAVSHLIAKGHRVIGMVNGSLDDFISFQLFEGYKDALNSSGIQFQPELIVEVENTGIGGYQGFLKLVELENPPTAIFVAGDLMTAGVVEAIKTGGYLIPEEVAVVGYGDTMVLEIVQPPLTRVKLPLRELGQGAVNQLIKVIKGEKLTEPFEVLIPELIIGRST